MPEIARLIAVAEADTSQAERSLERLGQKFDQTVNRARDAQGRFVKMGDAARGAMPHIDQFGSKLGVANNSLERLTGRLGGGSLGLAAMTTGVGSLTAGLALGGAAVLGYSGRLEQARIGFTTLLKSSQAAEQHLKQLEQFAARTPFEFPDVLQASRRFHAMGLETAQVIPLLTAVGDAVSAVGGGTDEINRVSLALSQVSAKGKVSAEELNQLADAGIGGAKILAQELGKTTGEVLKLAEQGKISSQVFLDAFQKFSKANFAGSMEKQSKTLLGSLSTLKDSTLLLADRGFAPLTEKINQASVAMADFASKQESISGAVGFFVERRFKEIGKSAFEQLFNPSKSIAADAIRQLSSGLVNGTGAIRSAAATLKRGFNEGWDSVRYAWEDIASGNFPSFGPPTGVPGFGYEGGLRPGQAPPPPTRVPGFQSEEDKLKDLSKYVDDFIKKYAQLQSELKEISPAKQALSDLASQVRTFGDDSALTAIKERFRAWREELQNLRDLGPEATAQFIEMERGAFALAKSLDEKKARQEAAKESDQKAKAAAEALAGQLREARERILELAGAARGGVTAVERFDFWLGNLEASSTLSADAIAKVRSEFERLGRAEAGEKLRRQAESIVEAAGGIAEGVNDSFRALGREGAGEVAKVLEQFASIKGLQISPQQLAPLIDIVKVTPDAHALFLAIDKIFKTVDTGFDDTQLEALKRALVNATQGASELQRVLDESKQLRSYESIIADLNRQLDRENELTQKQITLKKLAAFGINEETDARLQNALAIAGQIDKLNAEQAAQKARQKLLEKERAEVERTADRLARIFGRGFDDGWKGILSGFRDLLGEMQGELLRSGFLKLLQGLRPGVAQSGQPEQSATRSSGGGNIFADLIGRIFNFGGNNQASQQPNGPQRQDNTPGAIRVAGQAAVAAVTGAGEAQAGSIDKTGDSTTKAVVSSGQAIVGGLLNVASVIANQNTRGSFWKGLLGAAVTGGINGAFGALTGGVGGLSGLLGNRGGSVGGGLFGGLFGGGFGGDPNTNINGTGDYARGGLVRSVAKLATGGILSGPGTGTSDSILGIDALTKQATAWVSNGEFVVNARSTAKHRPLLEMINGGTLDLTQTIALATGGPVGEERPALFAPAARGALFPSAQMFAPLGPPAASLSGAGGDTTNNVTHQHHYNFRMDIHARDAESVRKSGGQIEREMRQRLVNASRRD